MNPVFGTLIENLRAIKLIYEPTVSPFQGDRDNTGNSREYTIQSFVASYLTQDYQIKKGKIYNTEGKGSQSIDCVVLAPNHPKLITPIRDVNLAEGVYVAIEVKPDIGSLTSKSEFHRGLKQMQSIKALDRSVERYYLSDPKPKYFDKIPAILFSFKSAPAEKIISYMQRIVKTGEINREELPDVIVTMDNGIIYYSPHIRHTTLYTPFSKEYLDLPNEVFIHFEVKDENLLALFLILILSFPGPDLKLGEPILKHYLSSLELSFKISLYSLNGEQLKKNKS